MGESISWFAVKGIDNAAIYERARLFPTGQVGDYSGGNGAHALAGGWTLVVLRGADHPLISSSSLPELATGCKLVACSVEEHVMACSSEVWKDGKRLWRVSHAAERNFFDLETMGDLPASFAGLEKQYRALQEAEANAKPKADQIFEIPLKLAQSITGFRHDETPFDEFELLEWRRPKPWWRFW
jgi:hypothetical protein